MDTLQEKLDYWTRKNPQKVCVIEAESGKSITYEQYYAAVYALRRLLGDRPRRILSTLPTGILSTVLWTCSLIGGHMLIPIASESSTSEKTSMIRRYSPDVLFVEDDEHGISDKNPQRFTDSHTLVVTHEQGMALVEHTTLQQVNEGMPMKEGSVILHTSGSTGEPKGVHLQEHHITWTADHICRSHRLTEEDRAMTVLPLFHVNAPVVSLSASLLSGGTVILAKRFSRRAFWSWVERYQATWVSIVPTILALLLDTEKPPFLPGDVRFVRTASAPLPAAQLRAFEAKFGLPVIETYGLTEAASQVTANPVPPGRHKPGSVGLPVGVDLRICTQHEFHDVVQGEVGEICVRGPGVVQAYVGNADAEVFQDGWFRTGDLGYQDNDGYLYITGRLREVIIRGGENVAPREVEETLLGYPGVREVAVVGRPDALYGEVVVAYVVVENPHDETLKANLHTYAVQHLSRPKVPVDFILVESLPHTSSGKVAHQELREQETSGGR